MAKRTKISFASINGGKYETINREQLVESSRRISKAMTVVVRRHKQFEALSRDDASKLVLNA